MSAIIERQFPTPAILAIRFSAGFVAGVNPVSGKVAGNIAMSIELHAGDVMDISEFGAAAPVVLEALTGPVTAAAGLADQAGLEIRYLDFPRHAWPAEDLLRFQSCARLAARLYCDGGNREQSQQEIRYEFPCRFPGHFLGDTLGDDRPLALLETFLRQVPGTSRIIIIDQLQLLVPAGHMPLALKLLQRFAVETSSVVIFSAGSGRESTTA